MSPFGLCHTDLVSFVISLRNSSKHFSNANRSTYAKGFYQKMPVAEEPKMYDSRCKAGSVCHVPVGTCH